MNKPVKVLAVTGEEVTPKVFASDGRALLRVPTRPNTRYEIVDEQSVAGGPQKLRAKRIGNDLLLTLDNGDGQPDISLVDYYRNCVGDSTCDVSSKNAEGYVGAYVPYNDEPSLLLRHLSDGTEARQVLMNTAFNPMAPMAPGAIEGASSAGALAGIGLLPLLGGLGLLGAAAAAAAGGGGGGGGGGGVISDNTPTITTVHDDVDVIGGPALVGANIQKIAHKGTTNDASPLVEGTIEKALATGQSVEVWRFDNVNGTPVRLGTATVNGTGWTFADKDLADTRTYTYRARIVDTAGKASANSNDYAITYFSNLPTKTPDMTDATDTGVSNVDDKTNNPQPDFAIDKPKAGEEPVLFINGAAVPFTSRPSDDGTKLLLTPTTKLPDGKHMVGYGIKKDGVVHGPGPELEVVIDTVAPNVKDDPAFGENQSRPAPSDATPISGTAKVTANDTDPSPSAGEPLYVAKVKHETLGTLTTFDLSNNTIDVAEKIQGNFGTLKIAEDGTYTYTPDPTKLGPVKANVAAVDTFLYWAKDLVGNESGNPAKLVFAFTGVDDKPGFQPDNGDSTRMPVDGTPAAIISDGVAYEIPLPPSKKLTVVDYDTDAKDLTFTLKYNGKEVISAGNNSATFSIDGKFGTLTGVQSGKDITWTFRPNEKEINKLFDGSNFLETFEFSVADQSNPKESIFLNYEISPKNDVPEHSAKSKLTMGINNLKFNDLFDYSFRTYEDFERGSQAKIKVFDAETSPDGKAGESLEVLIFNKTTGATVQNWTKIANLPDTSFATALYEISIRDHAAISQPILLEFV